MKKILISLICVFSLFVAPVAYAASVTLAWDASASSGVTGYKIYVSNTSGSYTTGIDVGNVLTFTVQNLQNGTTYYFVATAYNPSNESGYSNEVSTTTPWGVPAPPNLKPVVSSIASLETIKNDLYTFKSSTPLNSSQSRTLTASVSQVTQAKTNLIKLLKSFAYTTPKAVDTKKGLRIISTG